MTKIALCSLNSKYIHSSLAPWYLLSSIKSSLPEVEAAVYENTINADFENILEDLLNLDAEIYGFSCYIWNIEYVIKVAEKIKAVKKDVLILLGGPEVSYNCEEVLKNYIFVDYIISGEGEDAIVNFLSGKDIKTIEGLSFRGNISAPAILKNEPLSPFCDEYFENLRGRIAYIETSRGCPYSCAFCLSGRCGSVRYFNLENVFKNIIKLANSGTKTVKFVDRTFNANSERANKIITFILENSGKLFPGDVCFHFEIAGDILKEETINILKKAPVGLFQLEIGLQTFNEDTLEYINRRTDTEKLISNIKKLISLNNMHIHVDLIAGLPLEDMASFKNTFNRAYYLKSDMLQLGFLKLLHGSPMRNDSSKFSCRYSSRPPYEVIDTPWLSSDELKLLHRCENALDRLYNSGRFLQVLDYLVFEKKVEPFKLFCDFGVFSEKIENTSLDEYSKMFFEYVITNLDNDRNLIRDKFVCDRMASNSSGKLPEFLKEERNEYSQIKRCLKSKGIKENFAILSTKKLAVFQNKSVKEKNGRFNLIFKEFDELICQE